MLYDEYFELLKGAAQACDGDNRHAGQIKPRSVNQHSIDYRGYTDDGIFANLQVNNHRMIPYNDDDDAYYDGTQLQVYQHHSRSPDPAAQMPNEAWNALSRDERKAWCSISVPNRIAILTPDKGAPPPAASPTLQANKTSLLDLLDTDTLNEAVLQCLKAKSQSAITSTQPTKATPSGIRDAVKGETQAARDSRTKGVHFDQRPPPGSAHAIMSGFGSDPHAENYQRQGQYPANGCVRTHDTAPPTGGRDIHRFHPQTPEIPWRSLRSRRKRHGSRKRCAPH